MEVYVMLSIMRLSAVNGLNDTLAYDRLLALYCSWDLELPPHRVKAC